MSRRSFITGFLLFGAALVGYAVGLAQEPAAQAPLAAVPLTSSTQLKTLEEQAAYAIGLDMGRDVLANFPEVDPNLVARGLIDAMRGAKPLLTPAAAQAALNRLIAKKLGPGAEKNLQEGQAYLATNKTKQGVKTTFSGLQYFVTRAAGGPSPKETDVVRVNYTGMLLDGKVFDSTNGKEPAEFPVNRVIPGWTEALQKMKVGEKWRLYVPAELAYGPSGPEGGPIPPFAALIFDVELLAIVQ
jgi:FKBP-type peptidyl-prolyl cis-trans isomerase